MENNQILSADGKRKIEIIEPHDVPSRAVMEPDLARVRADAEVMLYLCQMQHGLYRNGLAVAHSQITKDDPLRFFVTAQGLIVINPVITNHTKHGILHEEGCLTFSQKPPAYVTRWYKIEVSFYTLKTDGTLSEQIKGSAKGEKATQFIHLNEHFNSFCSHHQIWQEKEKIML